MKNLKTSLSNINESLNAEQSEYINYVADMIYFIGRYGSDCIDISDFKYAVMDFSDYAPAVKATPEFYKKLGEAIFEKL